jgi:hypothetical protein
MKMTRTGLVKIRLNASGLEVSRPALQVSGGLFQTVEPCAGE